MPFAFHSRHLRFLTVIAALGVALGGCQDHPFVGDLEDDAQADVLAGEAVEGVVGETTQEVVIRVRDGAGSPLVGVSVRFDPAPGAGAIVPAVAVTDSEGMARGEWTLGPLAGEQRVEVVLASSGASLGMLRAEAHPGPPFEVSVLPEAVAIQAGAPFALQAFVRDFYGNAITSVPMEWTSEDRGIAVVNPEGRVTGLAIGSTGIEAMLHADAATTHPEIYEALGAVASGGPQEHHRDGHTGGRSQVDVVDGDGEAFVTATSGDGQVGMVGEQLAEPLGVRVTDADGVPLRQVAVEWRVEAGGGSVSRTVTHTDGQGRASVEWTLGPTAGTNRVQARVGDLGSVTFSATALDGTEDGSGDTDDGSGGDTGDDGSGDDDGGDDGSSDDGNDGGSDGDDGSSGGDGDDGSSGGDGDGDDSPGTPGQVTDLRVHATDASSATLRFTQVDDGNGEPANYEVRFALHPIGFGWGSASLVTEGTCSGEIVGTAPGETFTCTVEGLEPSTKYDFQLVSFRGLISDGSRVYGELSNVATGQTDGSTTVGSAECGNPRPEWVWCDDFEADRLSSYFEYSDGGGAFTRASGVGRNGSWGMRTRFRQGQVSAGSLKLAFGRTPDHYFRAIDEGTRDYQEIYWRVYVRLEDSWIGGGGDKLSRVTSLVNSSWAQSMIGHIWSGQGDHKDVLVMDPASGTDEDGNLMTTKYNDFDNLRWLGLRRGTTPLFADSHVGEWYCVEARVRLNTPGSSDGVFEFWVDDRLEARRTDLNWRGQFTDYGINAMFLENYWNEGAPQAQERYFDNLVVSTQRIGC